MIIYEDDAAILDARLTEIKDDIGYNEIENTVDVQKLSKIMNFYPNYDDDMINYYLTNNDKTPVDVINYGAYYCAKLINKLQNNISVPVLLYIDVFDDRDSDVFFGLNDNGFEFKAYLFLNIPMTVELHIEYV